MMSFPERVARRGWRVIEPEAQHEAPPNAEAQPIGAAAKWLNEVLTDADKSGRLSGFERDFVNGLRRRFERSGTDTKVTPAQIATLRRIEEKIYAAG